MYCFSFLGLKIVEKSLVIDRTPSNPSSKKWNWSVKSSLTNLPPSSLCVCVNTKQAGLYNTWPCFFRPESLASTAINLPDKPITAVKTGWTVSRLNIYTFIRFTGCVAKFDEHPGTSLKDQRRAFPIQLPGNLNLQFSDRYTVLRKRRRSPSVPGAVNQPRNRDERNRAITSESRSADLNSNSGSVMVGLG